MTQTLEAYELKIDQKPSKRSMFAEICLTEENIGVLWQLLGKNTFNLGDINIRQSSGIRLRDRIFLSESIKDNNGGQIWLRRIRREDPISQNLDFMEIYLQRFKGPNITTLTIKNSPNTNVFNDLPFFSIRASFPEIINTETIKPELKRPMSVTTKDIERFLEMIAGINISTNIDNFVSLRRRAIAIN